MKTRNQIHRDGQKMKKEVTMSRNYLLIPVKTEKELSKVSIFSGGVKIFEFAVPVGISAGKEEGIYEFSYYAAVPMTKWKNRQIIIEGDVPENFLDAVAQSDSVPENASGRPIIHFAPDTGWLNDPNGLIFQDGIYHLYFQHNPFDTRWENMSWGHAVSRDLLHWEQKEDVLFPDGDGTMFSGCGIVNEQGKLGLERDAEIFFYTCAGGSSEWSKDKKFVQKIAYSKDHGNTLIKREGCVLEHIAGENRDPKVYWHEKRGLYYMALYLEKNDYAIFTSENLEQWEMLQRLTLPQTIECPDFREMPVQGGGSKWMFWGADGHYFLGDFDGFWFVTDGIRREAYQTMLPYAAQSFWGSERVIMIPWLRTDNRGKAYRGVMGIPRQLSLVKKDGDYVLRQKLVDEFEECKEKVFEQAFGRDGGAGAKDCDIVCEQKCDAAVEVLLNLEDGADFTVNLYGTVCTYEAKNAVIKIQGIAERGEAVKKAAQISDKEKFSDGGEDGRYLKVGKGAEKISFLSDGEILEVTVDDGLICGAYETKADGKKGRIRVRTKGKGRVEIFQIK